MPDIIVISQYADRLNASGINLVSAMEGVMRSNEQNRMRATVENMRVRRLRWP